MIEHAFLAGLALGGLVGFALGLAGYARARDNAYRAFLEAQARSLGLRSVLQDVQ